jgi:hypothetical protein
VSFNRSPTWITTEFGIEFAQEGRETRYSDAQKDKWALNPREFLEYRKKFESSANGFFDLQLKDSEIQKRLFEHFDKKMSSILDKKNLSSLIIPKFAVGCRR